MRLVCCAVLLVTGLSYGQDRRTGEGINFFGKDKEAALGQQLAANLRKETTPLDITAVTEYVNRVGGKLAVQMPVWTYQFELVRGNVGCEPAALPGGPIFISAELIASARDEAEFAGMLAHAMAHVEARHGTRLATKSELMQINRIVANQALAQQAPGSQTPQPAAEALARGFEREADYLAVNAMAAVGYDPEGLASYIDRVQPADSSTSKDRWSPKSERLKLIREAIGKLPPATYPVSDAFGRIKALVVQ